MQDEQTGFLTRKIFEGSFQKYPFTYNKGSSLQTFYNFLNISFKARMIMGELNSEVAIQQMY